MNRPFINLLIVAPETNQFFENNLSLPMPPSSCILFFNLVVIPMAAR